MFNPKISVVLPVYKEKPEWIEKSIKSILDQTFKDFELIIIIDNPEKNINDEIIESFSQKDCRVKVIKNSENLGLPRSLNLGIEVSTANYIARMDADDISSPERLSIQYQYMEENPKVGVCGTSGIYIDDNDNEIGKMNVEISDSKIKGRLLFSSCFIHPSVIIRKHLLQENKYNPLCRCSQDVELWIRLASQTIFHNIDKPLIKYRIHPNKAQEREGKKNLDISYEIIAPRCAEYWSISNDYKEIYVAYYSRHQISNRNKDYLFEYLATNKNLRKFYSEIVKQYIIDIINNHRFTKIFFNPLFKNNPIHTIKEYSSILRKVLTGKY